jgi:hypothetical protein
METAHPPGDDAAGRPPVRVLVNACIDFRFVDALTDWLRDQGLRGQYDLRTHEGCAATVEQWIESDVRIGSLHDLGEVWIVDHDDCGAYKLRGEPNTYENHVQHLRAAQARVQAWLGRPCRIFFHHRGPDGRGAATVEEVLH